jgi:hypothetical protein
MGDRNDEVKGQGPAMWPQSDREAAGSVAGIDSRIAVFSIRALGYDPDSNDPKPRELLEWVQRRQVTQRRRRQALGAGLTALLTAFLGGVSWPLIRHLIAVFGL